MTEPKPTRFLSARLREWTEAHAMQLLAALEAADNAHDVEDEEESDA